MRGWASTGVSPFNEKVYWDLKAAEAKAEKVATLNELNSELLTLKGAVGIMYGVEGEVQQVGRRRKREACLHSSDLWNLPGGATGDECFNIVKSKTEAKEALLASCRAAKAARVQEKQVKMAASLELGQKVVASLSHDAQIAKLKMPAIVAALAFKCEPVQNGLKKAALIQLLRMHLKLPADGVAPPLPYFAYDVEPRAVVPDRCLFVDLAPVAEPTAPDVDESGSDKVASDASDDDV